MQWEMRLWQMITSALYYFCATEPGNASSLPDLSTPISVTSDKGKTSNASTEACNIISCSLFCSLCSVERKCRWADQKGVVLRFSEPGSWDRPWVCSDTLVGYSLLRYTQEIKVPSKLVLHRKQRSRCFSHNLFLFSVLHQQPRKRVMKEFNIQDLCHRRELRAIVYNRQCKMAAENGSLAYTKTKASQVNTLPE